MSRTRPRERQPVDDRGTKRLTSAERKRVFAVAAGAEPNAPAFARTPPRRGARVAGVSGDRVTEVRLLAAREPTLTRLGESRRKIPIPGRPGCAPEPVRALRGAGAMTDSRLWSRTAACRKFVRIAADAGIEGRRADPKGLRLRLGGAAVTANLPRSTVEAALGRAGPGR